MGHPIPPAGAAAIHPLAWAAYASQGKWIAARHLRYIGDRVMRVHRGERLRLVVSMPPRHGKSELLSRYLPSWWLGTRPTSRVILVTMQERFSRRYGRRARDDFHQFAEPLWGVTTWARSSTAEWEVFQGSRRTEGSMSAIGAGGTITGKGAHLLLIDDLIRNMAEAQNESLREQQYEWFESACLTRLEPGGAVIILMTRWHHDDLIGRLMKKQANGELGEPWEFINLPALAEEGDPLGRAPGEALWPERYSREALLKKQREVGPFIWQALYQGNPTPRDGSIFKRPWFRYFSLTGNVEGGDARITASYDLRGSVDVMSDQVLRYATVDLAASKKKRADYTVVCVWGFVRAWGALLLLDVVRVRLSGPEIVPTLKRVRERYDLPLIYVEREGPLMEERIGNVIRDAVRENLPILELKPEGDKVARAYNASGPVAAGQVLLRKDATWLGELEAELLEFPDGRHDDQVDAFTYGVGVYQDLAADGGEDDAPRQPPEDPDGGWDLGARSDRPWWLS